MLLVTGVLEGMHLLYFVAVLIGASIPSLANALLTLAVVAGGYFAYNVGVGGLRPFLTPQYLLCIPFLLVVVCLVNFISEQSRRLRAALEQKSHALERTAELLHEKERQHQAHQAESFAELQEAHQRLAELNEYNRNILQSVNTAVIITDLFGRVTTCNRAAAAILEVDPTSLLGQPLESLPRVRPLVELVKRTTAEGVAQPRCDARIHSSSGRTISLGVGISPLQDRTGQAIGAIAFFQDITEVIALRESLTRSENLAALGRLSAEVAHEIRNPLNAIRGFSQLIHEATPDDASLHTYAGTIMGEVDRLSEFMTDVLDFARPAPAKRVPVELRGLVEETLGLVRQRTKLAGIETTVEGAGEVACLGDGDKLKQVFLNIVLNAIDAMEGGGTLAVRVRPDADPAFVRIEFQDTGCGIPASKLGKIFTPFYTRKQEGTGLGLSVSNRIVEAHGGRIDVESTVGVGSTFTVRLPAASASQAVVP
jgi:PAS domain S-box-containing protein